MRTLIKGGTLVNEGRLFEGSILIEDSQIVQISTEPHTPEASYDEVIDASGCFVLPGIIDDHVHFREPGLTAKADIESESRAAAAGGVTTYFDMPNTVPQTTTLEALDEKFALAAQKSHVNYSFFFGATNDNAALLSALDVHRIPGVKLFMGSSTGNMLVDRREALDTIFASSKLPIMTHCEDTDIINRNMAEAIRKYGDDPKVTHHPEIRSEEACYESTRLAVELAKKHHARLHVAHLTTAHELELISPDDPAITAEATVSHLYFYDRDYAALGTRIKCNPAIKTLHDRDALREALNDGRIRVMPESSQWDADDTVLVGDDARTRGSGCALHRTSGGADVPQSSPSLRGQPSWFPARGLSGRYRVGAPRYRMDGDQRCDSEQMRMESDGRSHVPVACRAHSL